MNVKGFMAVAIAGAVLIGMTLPGPWKPSGPQPVSQLTTMALH
jgi:hypothetical protein